MPAPDDDFEFHTALESVAPAAVRALLDIVDARELGAERRMEALSRLRWMRESALFDALPVDLRHRANRLLDG